MPLVAFEDDTAFLFILLHDKTYAFFRKCISCHLTHIIDVLSIVMHLMSFSEVLNSTALRIHSSAFTYISNALNVHANRMCMHATRCKSNASKVCHRTQSQVPWHSQFGEIFVVAAVIAALLVLTLVLILVLDRVVSRLDVRPADRVAADVGCRLMPLNATECYWLHLQHIRNS